MHNPNILVLTETRVSGEKANIILNGSQIQMDRVEKVEARGFKGGIWMFWNSQEVTLELISANDQSITAIIRSPGAPCWVFTAVYASPQQAIRDALWDYIRQLATLVNGPWVIAGDMNVVIDRSEKTGGAPVDMNKCKRFLDCVHKVGLLDLKFLGNPFTWAKGGNSPLQSRLDRALCNADWRLSYPRAVVKHLPRIASTPRCY